MTAEPHGQQTGMETTSSDESGCDQTITHSISQIDSKEKTTGVCF